MSVPVELADLAEKVAAFGPVAYLVTANEDGSPHVVSVAPGWSDGDGSLRAAAGSRTSGNAARVGKASLLWPGAPGGDYALIVDGSVDAADGEVVLRPTRAVLHRVAGADAALPSCVTVL